MEINNQIVQLICREHFKSCILESFREVKEAGRVNHIFEIKISKPSKSLILKVYPPRWEHYKPQKEKFVYELIKEKTGLPVPEIYVLDDSKKRLKLKILWFKS